MESIIGLSFSRRSLGAAALSPYFGITESPTVVAARTSFIFSVDQALANGPLENGDLHAFQLTVDSLKPLARSYPTYALLACDQRDRGQLDAGLELLARSDIPFVLDALSSDALAQHTMIAPVDASHGLERSIADLQLLKNRYGSMFAGIRIMEPFSIDFTIFVSRERHVDWDKWFKDREPKDRFFQEGIVEDLFRFSHSNGMRLYFSDWLWTFDHPPTGDIAAIGLQEHEGFLRRMLKRYPQTGVPMYANNEPGGRSAKMVDWASAFQPFAADGAVGFGLSDQSWLYRSDASKDERDCPVSVLIDWARKAIERGAVAIQTEPFWYWWNYPRGSETNTYAQPDQPRPFGRPRQTLLDFAAALNVNLSPS